MSASAARCSSTTLSICRWRSLVVLASRSSSRRTESPWSTMSIACGPFTLSSDRQCRRRQLTARPYEEVGVVGGVQAYRVLEDEIPEVPCVHEPIIHQFVGFGPHFG